MEGKYSYIWGCPNFFTTKDRTHKRKPLRQKKQLDSVLSVEMAGWIKLIARKLDHHAGKTSFQKPAALRAARKPQRAE